MDEYDKLVLEVYDQGQFTGYLKSISVIKNKFTMTPYKGEAKKYAKQQTAEKEMKRLLKILSNTVPNRSYIVKIS